MDIVNETGEAVVVRIEEATAVPEGAVKVEVVWRSPTREEVLEGLRRVAASRDPLPHLRQAVEVAIAYLETDPAGPWKALAARMWAAVSAAWNAAASATHDCSLRSDVLALTKDSALLLWDDPREDLVAEAERWLAERIRSGAEALAEDYAARMEAEAETWEGEGVRFNTPGWRHRAEGLREAARMLRTKEGR